MAAAESGWVATALVGDDELAGAALAAVDAGRRLMTAPAPSAPPARPPIRSSATASTVPVRGRPPPRGAAGDGEADVCVGSVGSVGSVGGLSNGSAIIVSMMRDATLR